MARCARQVSELTMTKGTPAEAATPPLALFYKDLVLLRFAAKVLTPYHADFRLPAGTQHQVSGFSAVREKAFRALPAETVTDWHAKCWLDLVALHLASLQNFQGLLDFNAQRANERKALA